MNNLVYGSDDPSAAASKIEELLRAELGATSPVPYERVDAGATHGAGALMRDTMAALFGGAMTPLFAVHFRIAHPRPAILVVNMMRQDALVVNTCWAGPLWYNVDFAKPVTGKAELGPPKFFGTAQFTGDTGTIAKLNARKDLCKKADKFAMVEGGLASHELRVPRYLALSPVDGGTRLMANTLPRSKSMGFGASLGAQELFELAALIDAAL